LSEKSDWPTIVHEWFEYVSSQIIFEATVESRPRGRDKRQG
jgi:hypothetical protein